MQYLSILTLCLVNKIYVCMYVYICCNRGKIQRDYTFIPTLIKKSITSPDRYIYIYIYIHTKITTSLPSILLISTHPFHTSPSRMPELLQLLIPASLFKLEELFSTLSNCYCSTMTSHGTRGIHQPHFM